MKVLWFTNTPSLAEGYFGESRSGGGWLKALEANLKQVDGIELSVAFYAPSHLKKFEYNGSVYYPINIKRNKFQRILDRALNRIEDEEDLIRCKEIIDDFQPDIIHIHGSENPFGLLALDTAVKIPMVLSIQGILSVYEKFYFRGMSKSDVKKQLSVKDILAFANPLVEYRLMKKKAAREQLIFKYMKNILGRTDWDAYVTNALAPAANYFKSEELLRENFYSNIWTAPRNKKITLFTTMSNPVYKGFETIAETITYLSQYDITWKIAGITKSDLVYKHSKSKGLLSANKLEVLGKLDEFQLVEQMQKSDLYVSVSHIENSPNNICEAMILGMPVIASYAGGTGSLLEHNGQGLLVQDGDAIALAGAIISMIQNYEHAVHMGTEARKRALLRHDPSILTQTLTQQYTSIIKNNKD